MVQLAQLLSLAVLGATSVMARPNRAFIYSDTNFRGAYAEVPTTNVCHNVRDLKAWKDLTGKVESAALTPGIVCSFYSDKDCSGRVYTTEESAANLADEAYGVGEAVVSVSCAIAEQAEQAQEDAEDDSIWFNK
ncbi:hypothetical protein HFD88_000239 [Aspergillus terreus]|nr:hypothetical protein HFD88_000239 [Aspergillus terreus]